ncbi:hypothetical protein [Vampirovibrio chlorellavorus]|uniref:hypothetical protein n=1 Tax=Vampirovibrio chlorellavorus TaxID=758823 RepID=UPI0026F198DA|nr:hypothetical protein [Vampirovibrio chlorellavorus]
MGLQPIFHLMRSPGSWSQWTAKLKQFSGSERGRCASEQSAEATTAQTLSRTSSGKLSVSSQGSGDTWSTVMASSTESLGASLLPEAFNAFEQGLIRHEMARCRYGLGWQWLNPKSRIRIQLTPDGRLQFAGYQGKAKTDPMQPPQGDCQQLALQLGQRLHQRFQGRYKFYVVAGNYPQSPWRVHYFLMGWPAREDAYFMGKTRGGLHPFTKQPTARIPKEAFLIDPTYQVMGFAAQHDRLGQYIAVHPQFLEVGKQGGAYKSKTCLSFGETDQLSPGLPLGFARDLLPGHAEPEAIAFAHFKRSHTAPDVPNPSNQPAHKIQHSPARVQVQLGWGDQPLPSSHWRQTIPPHAPLYQMLCRLETEAANATAETAANPIGCLPWNPLSDSHRIRLKPSRK